MRLADRRGAGAAEKAAAEHTRGGVPQADAAEDAAARVLVVARAAPLGLGALRAAAQLARVRAPRQPPPGPQLAHKQRPHVQMDRAPVNDDRVVNNRTVHIP